MLFWEHYLWEKKKKKKGNRSDKSIGCLFLKRRLYGANIHGGSSPVAPPEPEEQPRFGSQIKWSSRLHLQPTLISRGLWMTTIQCRAPWLNISSMFDKVVEAISWSASAPLGIKSQFGSGYFTERLLINPKTSDIQWKVRTDLETITIRITWFKVSFKEGTHLFFKRMKLKLLVPRWKKKYSISHNGRDRF